jgi:hypothetical protein
MMVLTAMLYLGLGPGTFIAALQDSDLQKKIEQLIQSLGDDSKETRDRAVTELGKVGKPALDALRKAAQAQDAEVKSLAAQAIERIEWGTGLDKLRQYVKERYDDGATVEPCKLKSIQRWFPEYRFYEVAAGGAAPGAAVMMGRGGGASVFAVHKFEDGFTRVIVKGVFAGGSFKDILRTQKIKLPDYETAFDFGLAFLEIYWMSSGYFVAGGNSRFDKSDDGWEFQSQNYGMSITFKTDKDGLLTEIVQPNYKYWQQGGNSQKLGEEKSKLEIEKLKIELELLRRQLDEAKKK